MLAFIEFPAAGLGPYPIHALDYLDTAHLAVTVNAVPASATFDDANKLMTLAASPAAGATIRVQRVTPRESDQRLTQFLDLASGAPGLTADLLDQDYRQNMLILGEGRDPVVLIDAGDGMTLDGGHWDAQGLRIEDLSPGSDSSDAATRAQLDTVDTTTRNLPTAVLDNDDGLFVVAGEWDDLAPAGARTALDLGTVATLNAGVAANNVIQLDSSARYPAADGRNIDLAAHPDVLKRALATVVKFTRLAFPGNGLDPAVGTWSQNSSSRVAMSGSTWSSRIELNNSSDVDGSVSANGVVFSAGTWRIRVTVKLRHTGGTNRHAFRITNNDDTSAQTIFLDSGVTSLVRSFSAGQSYYFVSHYELIIANASQFALVFRIAAIITGANNDADVSVFLHKISSSVLA